MQNKVIISFPYTPHCACNLLLRIILDIICNLDEPFSYRLQQEAKGARLVKEEAIKFYKKIPPDKLCVITFHYFFRFKLKSLLLSIGSDVQSQVAKEDYFTVTAMETEQTRYQRVIIERRHMKNLFWELFEAEFTYLFHKLFLFTK